MLTPNFTLNSKIYLTFRCNCSCSYCAEKYFGVATTSDMTEKTLIEIISTLLRTTRSITNNVTIGFTGGEPLLNFDIIPDAYNFLYKKYPQLKSMCHTFSTNLTILSISFLDFVKRNKNFSILVSLNPESHTRLYTTGEETVFDVERNLAILKQNNITPIIHSVLTSNYFLII